MSSDETHASDGTRARRFTLWLWISGALSILLGVVALVFPFAATLAAELLFGAVLVAVGVIQLFSALAARQPGNRLWLVLFGAVALCAGGLMLLYPLEGALTLTILLASFLVTGGTLQIFSAWYLRPLHLQGLGLPGVRGWRWLAAAGALSVLLGAVLLFGLPGTAVWTLGLLLGLDLIFLGIAEIVCAQTVQRVR